MHASPVSAHSFLSSSLSHPVGSVVYLGMMMGAFFWGGMSDKVGRRQCLLICMSMNGFFAFLSSFVQGYGFFLVCRMIAGFGWVFCCPYWTFFMLACWDATGKKHGLNHCLRKSLLNQWENASEIWPMIEKEMLLCVCVWHCHLRTWTWVEMMKCPQGVRE